MGKYKRIFIIAIIIFMFLVLKPQGNERTDIELLIEAFRETNTVLDNYYLHIGTAYMEIEDDQLLLQEGRRLSEAFMLPKGNTLERLNNRASYQTSGTWGSDTKVEMSLKKINEQTSDTYLVFHLTGRDSLEDLKLNYIHLSENLQKIQISPKINSCIQGLYNDKLDNTEQFVLIDKVLEKLAASKVEMLNTDLVKSVSAYSNQLNHFIWTDDNKMNVQVATHFDNYHKKTVVTLGTPIITIEY